MPEFSPRSLAQLRTCDPRLQQVMHEAINTIDFTVLEGYRSPERQRELFEQGLSRVAENGTHSTNPSRAVDIAPFPIDWKDRERFVLFAGFILGIAKGQGITLRWGGDWNHNFQVADERFRDLGHFELVD